MCLALGGLRALGILAVAGPAAASPRLLDARLRRSEAVAARLALAELPSSRAYVQTHNFPELQAFLKRVGGQWGVQSGDIVTVRVPSSALSDLGNLAGVTRVEAGAPMAPRLDRAVPLMAVDRVHSGRSPLHGSYTGRGVVVGVVDFAFDLSHPAFRRKSGSRVLGLWDLGQEGTPPPGFTDGHFCDAQSVAQGTCPHVCANEHGTHVAAIAVGGQVDDLPYVGVAPGAELLAVALAGSTLPDRALATSFSTSVCEAVKFIFSEADRLGKPAVVNVSLGSHAGPHDGSSLADACLDQLVGPGHILVASAGNEGDGAKHWRTDEQIQVHAGGRSLAEGEGARPVRAAFLLPVDFPNGSFEVEVWFGAGATGQIRVGVLDSSGREALTDPVTPENQLSGQVLQLGTRILGPVSLDGDVTPSDSHGVHVTIEDADGDGAEAERDWFLVVEGGGVFDAFIDITEKGGFILRGSSPAVSVDSSMTVGYPAEATGAIAVGSYISRNDWQSASGTIYGALGKLTGRPIEVGTLSAFSSRGPSRNPARTGAKPDVVAPGEVVISALGSQLATRVAPSSVVVAPPRGYFVSSGTSQSAPMVAGVVALMLERDPSLAPEAVKEILHQTALPLGESIGAAVLPLPEVLAEPSPLSGYGKVNALAALAATPEVNPGREPGTADASDCSVAVVSRRGRANRGGDGAHFWLGLALSLGLWRRVSRKKCG